MALRSPISRVGGKSRLAELPTTYQIVNDKRAMEWAIINYCPPVFL